MTETFFIWLGGSTPEIRLVTAILIVVLVFSLLQLVMGGAHRWK